MNASTINFNKLWQPALIAAAVAFLYAQVLAKLGFDWWTDDNYSHGLLVPFVIGYVIWLEFDKLQAAREQPLIWLGGSVILIALVQLLGGTLGAELFTQRISLVVILVGIVIYFFGAGILKFLVVPFVLLLLAIPIPQIIFNKIAFPLQIWASQFAVWGIRLFEVASVRKGNVIEILPRGATQIIALEVVEACSGIRSLMTLITLALILAYFTRTKRDFVEKSWLSLLKNYDFWRAVILMLSAIPIAILTNAARVTATGVLTFYYGKQATESFVHDIAGWLVYVVALGLLIALNFLLKKFDYRNAKTQIEEIQSQPIANQTSNIKHPLYLLIAVLLLGGIFINWFQQRSEAEVTRKPLTEFSAKLGAWQQKGNEIRFDANTESVLRTTDYTMREYVLPNGRLANLYVGYYASQRSGATYHSPQNCLPGAGWVMKQPELIEITTPAGKTFTANRFIIENGVYNEVLIYWYQGRGRNISSEYNDKFYTVLDSILRRRSDGAMVRVMTSVGNSEAEATQAANDLAAQTADQLSAYIPD